ncbi:MAG: glycosyltransferase family 2 protein [Opitutus sp.]|nr:glycosyltransferase family 2 protein [Opitutus sp.]MCS6247764.1 glycosyltransferase family 2 protein [Opitutus sp.]MCS6274244.1 glycosyltransferase family 2 protein [Opitutus sp.]MCS6278007.1 glycosyltransferase family 2 protein [Opitutus sp.]MCS6298885.1 glycosyltransferase family 2 protein [Opitutus sp.]
MSASIPISVCIVAKNEGKNLPRLLASVKSWVGEIIVVLNNTTDDSEAIARSFGANVHRLPWQGFRDTKNAALALCTLPWVLTLDADEEVSPALKQDILSFFAGDGPTRFAGVKFPRKVWLINRWITHGDWYPDLSLRLFRRDAAKWGGDAHVHEKIEITGPLTTLKGDLHHYTMPSIYQYINKIPYFTDLALKQQIEKGRTFSIPSTLFRSFWRFFRAYVLRRGFLDGYPGLLIAVFTAFSTFVRYSRLYEHLNGRDAGTSPGVNH